MKIITWNLNSRTNKRDLENQCNYLLAGKFDIITLQEVLLASQDFFKNFFRGMHSVSSFDLVEYLDLEFGVLIESLFEVILVPGENLRFLSVF